MPRIEVKYIACINRCLVNKVRWLDELTGKVYDDADATSSVYLVGNDFKEQPTMPASPRRWGNGRGVVEEVVPTAPPVPAAGYPDGNPKSVQGAKKYPLRLLPLPANIEVNRALENGCVKYGPANWRQTGVAATVYVDAALRHLFQWFDGGQRDAEDSGVHNLGHAMACLAILIDAEAAGTLRDDRPHSISNTDALLARPQP